MRPVVCHTHADQFQTPLCLKSRCGTYRAVVASDVLRLIELREDVLREDLPELHTHLIYTHISIETE